MFDIPKIIMQRIWFEHTPFESISQINCLHTIVSLQAIFALNHSASNIVTCMDNLSSVLSKLAFSEQCKFTNPDP